MTRRLARLLFFFVTVCLAVGEAAGKYRAVVFEHHPAAVRSKDHQATQDEAAQIVEQNLAAYEAALDAAGPADIAVFPECGLTGFEFRTRESVRHFLEKVIVGSGATPPCDASAPASSTLAMRRLSCLARKLHTYVVANLLEGDDGKQYNTAVAFDRNGSVVAKYRKVHLFTEPYLDAGLPDQGDGSSFATDFGVRFGMMVCFDLLFEGPSALARSGDLVHWAFPTGWFSEFPVFSSSAVQQAWSRGTGTTLLAANLRVHEKAMAGSSIVASGKVLADVVDYESPNQGTVISAYVGEDSPPPPLATESRISGCEDEEVATAASTLPKTGKLDLPWSFSFFNATAGSSGSLSVEQDGAQCKLLFEVTATTATRPELFALAVYKGTTPALGGHCNVICSVARCADDSQAACFTHR
jgi:predicted amidohydrolase